ncbi:spermatogenesis-associated protein 46 isoform X2 [Carassius auratus]|uniref:Spermatogenesis-associated protein 46 isoform X2 n=1 Tax=Carassius auratus TaxID=7957 RepID=A0A6P6NX46_CARAU|nr:spermatogenesis-associated protein 46 isoform X2 [Carassius auratus]
MPDDLQGKVTLSELEQLMTHIEQGWREGYSCRAFYRKLKDMKDCRELLTVQEEKEEAPASESDPQLCASLALRQSNRDEKLDMVLKWLQECLSSCWQ